MSYRYNVKPINISDNGNQYLSHLHIRSPFTRVYVSSRRLCVVVKNNGLVPVPRTEERLFSGSTMENGIGSRFSWLSHSLPCGYLRHTYG